MEVVEVNDEDELLRRLPNQPSFIGEDNTITSAVFKLSKADKSGDQALSINIRKLVTELAEIYDPNNHKLVMIRAQVPRACACDCIHTPLAGQYSHGSIIGYQNRYRKYFVKNAILYA